MKKQEVIIGRSERCDIQVDKYNKSVGRQHARLYRDPFGCIWIEDQNSINGTYVNGTPVVRKKVNASDIIMLGGTDGYELNLTQALKKIPMSQEEFQVVVQEMKPLTPQEFQAAFQKLEQVEKNHKEEKIEIEVSGYENMALKRHSLAAILSTVTIFLTALVGNEHCLRNTIAIVGGLSSLVIFYKSIKWESRSRKEMLVQKMKNEDEYYRKYACPDCRRSYKGTSWEDLVIMGKCPHCMRAFK